jgi:hypothetical protein
MLRFLSRAIGWSFTCLLACACGGRTGSAERTGSTDEALRVAVTEHSISYDYAKLPAIAAGVAGGEEVVFVGSPMEGRVLALSRLTGKPIGELPPPPVGFVLPFIMHSLGEGRLAVLDAGGFPQPLPFVPANPTIYEYTYGLRPRSGFSASLVRTVSFASVLVGFAEDFVSLDHGRYLLSDARLGSIWVADGDNTIRPGIVPKTFNPQDALPLLNFCSTMPEVQVGGIPFLFSGSTLPGVSPLAVRDGTVYYYSPCAQGLYAFPLASLFDHRAPYQRAADIRLVAPRPPNVAVEELLELTFNPFNPRDRFLYAADALQLRVIRLDVATGARQVVADDPKLFDFPASLGFLPPVLGVAPLVVVSNQQERTTLTNDAITRDILNPPFIVAKVFLTDD